MSGPIGLHIRLRDTVVDALQDALVCNVKHFQFFLAQAVSRRRMQYVTVSRQDAATFNTLREEYGMTSYMHSSYWINSATGRSAGRVMSERFLKHEFHVARYLGIQYLVLHPGTAIDYPTANDRVARTRGIEALATTLNALFKVEPEVTVLLENTAHGGRAIGSDLKDFPAILEKIEYPERIGLCLDFAHAFVYGYDLSNVHAFISLVDATMGCKHIKLIHLNDAYDPCGSMQDRHALPGEGLIGKPILQELIHHAAFRHIPKLIEPPLLTPEQLKKIILDISSW